MAEWTGLEPATPGVTGRYSNQLNYHSAVVRLFTCAVGTHGATVLPIETGFSCEESEETARRMIGVPTGIRTPVLTVKG
ncbi:TonB-dependent receptor [Novimethylophilus kurashikiensis]|uniref:TonB-dependent receptor n=1 Tax=Novimethylophilus kurashikiensis TaxID=1825523 RepID=A0A2R5F400_9PROT|nr:TonB-dependent receptor [Novimethylophilus kurashikiensis]